jgi:hypothetical protein
VSFFVTELLSVDELPHRAVVDLEATLGEFGHQPAARLLEGFRIGQFTVTITYILVEVA